ncbi:DDE-type integrase/transposase/recombinase [Maioricimonas sp. JC845]|uniref:DDE-type integrase/transposase/recombinase n=1 Tax=Maioricimonas sp. JC845 TaxID=3232138 RepID=UPI0034591C3F
MRRKRRTRRAFGQSANACHERRAEHKDQVCCWDFVYARTTTGTTLKWLSIVDEYAQECLALKVSRSITSEDVIDTPSELFAMRGVPQAIRSDNGPEFVSHAIRDWLKRLGIQTLYIAPGSPWEARPGRRPAGRKKARAAVDVYCGKFSLEAGGRVPDSGGVRQAHDGAEAHGVVEGRLQP